MLMPNVMVATERRSCGVANMPAVLVPVEQGKPIVLDKPIVLVGRHADCDFVILHSRKISRSIGQIRRNASDADHLAAAAALTSSAG